MTISDPTPETISISMVDSGSTRMLSGTVKSAVPAQMYSVKTCSRSLAPSPRTWRNTAAAARKLTKANPVPSHAATAREPRGGITASPATPARGMNRQLQARVSTRWLIPRSWAGSSSLAQRDQVVDVEFRAAPRHGDHQAEADHDLRGRDRHHDQREHLAAGLAVIAGERDQGEVRGVQHQLDGQQDDQRAAADEDAVEADPEQDRRHAREVFDADLHQRSLRVCGVLRDPASMTAVCSSRGGAGCGWRGLNGSSAPGSRGAGRRAPRMTPPTAATSSTTEATSKPSRYVPNSGTETFSGPPKFAPTCGPASKVWEAMATPTSATTAPPASSEAASCQSGVSRAGSSALPPR